ncbi:MAG: hypothetical protein LBS97_01500 [Treponema sp.]|nr:hypothetical protein [Treponema sp.]
MKGAYHRDLSAYCDASLIQDGNKHIFNSVLLEDHHALIPLDVLPLEASGQEKNVYGLVLRSFFRVCMKDFVYTEKELLFHFGPYTLKSRIRDVVQEGWKKTVPEEDGEQEVKNFDGKNCKAVRLDILDKKTAPLRQFSVDTLLAFMENPQDEKEEKLADLGTPATRAQILKTLFDREYIGEQGKKLYAARRGLFLLAELRKDGALAQIADVERTTIWEKQLQDNPAGFENAIKEYIKSCIKK